jgi:transmembrane sensor
MKHYNFFSVEDFVQDIRFRSWVKHAEEDVTWQEWINENPDKRDVIEEARAIVLAIHPVEEENITDAEIHHEIQGILGNLERAETPKVKPRAQKFSIRLRIAASIGVAMCVLGWYAVQDTNSNDLPVESAVISSAYDIERINKSDKPLLINLPDKSSVLLAKNSVIRYANKFDGKTREVVLKGNAFFEVTKDPAKPFYVYADQIVAKVLGTSFEIATDGANDQTRVTVKTGSVSVYADLQKNQTAFESQPNVILTKNEQFVYKSDVNQIQHIRLDSGSLTKLPVPDTYMEFEGTSVIEVFALLEKVYGVKFDYENAKIKECSITASFTDQPFTLKLDLICRSIGLQYKIVNDRVSISGAGCAQSKI